MSQAEKKHVPDAEKQEAVAHVDRMLPDRMLRPRRRRPSPSMSSLDVKDPPP